MKRNLVVTIEFQKTYLQICAIETINDNNVEIFNKQAPLNQWLTFIPHSLDAIANKTGITTPHISVIIENSPEVKGDIKVSDVALTLPDKVVTSEAVQNLLAKAKIKYENEKVAAINVQPLNYRLKDLITKSYSQAPLGKKGSLLKARVSVSVIQKEVFDWINKVAQKCNFQIAQMLLKAQALSQNYLSVNALNQGSSLLYIGWKHSFLTINEKKATTQVLSFPNLGYEKLLTMIAQTFNLSLEKAKHLLMVHGDLAGKPIVHLASHKLGTWELTISSKLKMIIITFIKHLLSLTKKYLEQAKAFTYPLVLAGNLNDIANLKPYLTSHFSHLMLYQPLSYCELKQENQATLGVINYNKIVLQILGQKELVLAKTHPNTLSALKKPKKRNWWSLSIPKWGGKYEWN